LGGNSHLKPSFLKSIPLFHKGFISSISKNHPKILACEKLYFIPLQKINWKENSKPLSSFSLQLQFHHQVISS